MHTCSNGEHHHPGQQLKPHSPVVAFLKGQHGQLTIFFVFPVGLSAKRVGGCTRLKWG